MKPIMSFDVAADIDEAEIKKFIDFVTDALRQKQTDFQDQAELVLAFVSSEQSRSLNKQFRQKDKSTDVLSFHSDDPDSVGELILCPEVIEAQATKNKWDCHHEYCYMIIHGILHLLGYEHETDDKDAAEMYALQDEIFFEYFPGAQ